MLDQQIVSACIADRAAYDRIKDYVRDTDCSPNMAFWLKKVREYYSRDPGASTIDRTVLRALGSQAITNPKHVDAILGTLDGLGTSSPTNVVEYVLNLRRYNLSAEFASSAMAGDRKKSDKLLDELIEIWDRTELEGPKVEVEYAKPWEDIDSVVGTSNRVPLGLPALDARIGGGALPGHHLLVFGRTEIGKSCLTIALSANLIKQGQRVLYVGNEDEINILKARMRLSLLNQSQAWVDAHPKKTMRLLNELCGDRLVMVKVTPGSISELEDLTAKHKPSVIVVDQIRNLSGPEDGMTQRMEHNAIRFRSLLNREKMIGLSVTQAGDRSQGHNAAGPIYLAAGDVDSSRVGLPGTVDLMLGVGASPEMLSRGLRMISFAKNKLASGLNSREPLCVSFNLERSTVTNGD
jgi:archaellum biogenesis ATPase FlaH